jgi:hypothetical protein
VDRTGVLLLTDRGLWQLDAGRWGQGRLLVEGAFASMAADAQHVYLRALDDPVGMTPGLARLVLDDNEYVIVVMPGADTCTDAACPRTT